MIGSYLNRLRARNRAFRDRSRWATPPVIHCGPDLLSCEISQPLTRVTTCPALRMMDSGWHGAVPNHVRCSSLSLLMHRSAFRWVKLKCDSLLEDLKRTLLNVLQHGTFLQMSAFTEQATKFFKSILLVLAKSKLLAGSYQGFYHSRVIGLLESYKQLTPSSATRSLM
jgi:hypothetical protein